MKHIIYKSEKEKNGTTNIAECALGCKQHSTNKHIWLCYAKNMGELAKEEAKHHDEDDEDPVTVHQLNAWRNTYYHQHITNTLMNIAKGSHLLEIGAGSGNDAKPLFPEYYLTLTDVSSKTLNRTYHRLQQSGAPIEDIQFIACDGEHLPFADNQFGGVFMVATFHHFEHPERGINEVHRVLTSGGTVILGVEPNKTYFKLIHIFQHILFKLTHTDTEHISKADAEMEGFSYKELTKLIDTKNWQEIDIKPMWFLTGFLHYKSEFLYRAFKLKKRITIPPSIEKIVVALDEFLFKLPGIKHLCWHWIIFAKKK